MLVIPAVDVLGGSVVRLARGSYQSPRIYAQDPVGTAAWWVEQGADLVHVVDLEGARSGNPDRGLWTALSGAGVPFQVGGGIRTPEAAQDALAAGAVRVVLGTTAVWSPETLAALAEGVGAHRVVAALDVRDGRAVGEGWVDDGREVAAVLAELRQTGVPRLLVTAVARDGMLQGPDVPLLEEVHRLAAEMAIIAAGGVAGLNDLRVLAGTPAEGVVVGRALYEGRFTLEEAIEAAQG